MTQATYFSAILKRLVEWFVRYLWPWIVREIWPLIRDLLVDIFKDELDTLKDSILDWINGRAREQGEAAHNRAAAAERMAQAAADEHEAEKQRAIAQVWREVAEQFRQENESLKSMLEEATSEARTSFTEQVRHLDLTGMIEDAGEGSIRLTDSGRILALPEPGQDQQSISQSEKRDSVLGEYAEGAE